MEPQAESATAAEPLVQAICQFAAEAALPEGVLSNLIAVAVLREYQNGDLLFRENATNDAILLMISGRVALEMNVPGRGNVRLLSLGAGDWLGWSALLGSGQMTTSAIVLADTRIAEFSAADIAELCEHNHSFGYHLMRHLAKALGNRLVATRLQLLDLFSNPGPTDRIDSCPT
jgi:CRP/FNR family transcriptional regulator, cyclic AMP receptor protein